MKFYRCKKCGQIVAKIEEKPCTPFCCGEEMEYLPGNTTDAAVEKHVPVVEESEGKTLVKVGAAPHPMLEAHHIAWLYVELEDGGILKYLDVDKPAEALFDVDISKVKAVYEYCNLHGLWKKEL